MDSAPRKVDIRPLKLFAREKIPLKCVLRDLLLTDNDELEAAEFLVKTKVWLRLLQVRSDGLV
jgi:hypothetical protein